MSIANDTGQRRQWLARLTRVRADIHALQNELTIAFQSKMPFPTVRAVVEADVHLSNADSELDEAQSRITSIS